jgi:dihydrolipoamide dehydrogenase
VTLVELLPELLAGLDAELVRPVLRRARARLAGLHLGTRVVGIAARGAGFTLELAADGRGMTLEADAVLVAVGRRPNTDDLGLERAGLAPDATGSLVVDERCRTAVPHLYAIGDVTPGPLLAHRAMRQGKVAAEVIAGRPAAFDNRAMPAVVFVEPELAVVGLSEDEARARGREVVVGRFPFRALGRARAIGEPEGLVKVVADAASQAVLGVGIVGASASELIAEAALAIELGATLEDVICTIHAHPTLPEALLEAAEVAAGAAVHLLPGSD